MRRISIRTFAEFWGGNFAELRWAQDCKKTGLPIKRRAATLETKGQFRAVPGAVYSNLPDSELPSVAKIVS